jgi:hypothetical protein
MTNMSWGRCFKWLTSSAPLGKTQEVGIIIAILQMKKLYSELTILLLVTELIGRTVLLTQVIWILTQSSFYST